MHLFNLQTNPSSQAESETQSSPCFDLSLFLKTPSSNENEIRNTENLVQAQNESNIAYKDSNNHSIINESRSNNSILNTSEKRHLYYFNDLKYEN